MPWLVRDISLTGDQAYCVEKDKLALVGTSEVPMVSYYSKEMLKEENLPIRLTAQSTCFRREAGTYGKDTKGLYRVHQFQKVEQVILGVADKEDTDKLHDELLQNSEEIMQALELPYQVVYVCTGDLGQGQVRKHDIETWMPSRKATVRLTAAQLSHDFQARRLGIRYKNSEGKKNVCYTLNNTAIATPRVLIPLSRDAPTKDGRIKIPKVLQPYMGGQEYIG